MEEEKGKSDIFRKKIERKTARRVSRQFFISIYKIKGKFIRKQINDKPNGPFDRPIYAAASSFAFWAAAAASAV